MPSEAWTRELFGPGGGWAYGDGVPTSRVRRRLKRAMRPGACPAHNTQRSCGPGAGRAPSGQADAAAGPRSKRGPPCSESVDRETLFLLSLLVEGPVSLYSAQPLLQDAQMRRVPQESGLRAVAGLGPPKIRI